MISRLTLNIAALSARLLEEQEVFPRARIIAQTIAEALPGSAVNVYATTPPADGDAWTATSKTSPAKNRVRGNKREVDPTSAWGRPKTLAKNQA